MPWSFQVFILWLHLLAAVVWIGGLLFQLLAVAPALKRIPSGVERLRLSVSLEIRFRYVMWPAVGLVLLTGLYNVMNVLYATALANGGLPPTFVPLLSVKLVLVALMLVLQAVQRFALHTRTITILARLSSETTELPRTLLQLHRLSRLVYLLIVSAAAAVMLLGLLL